MDAAVRCAACTRVISEGESAWASDWTVIDASGTRAETRYTCDDCMTGVACFDHREVGVVGGCPRCDLDTHAASGIEDTE